jgi:hypothetical protein
VIDDDDKGPGHLRRRHSRGPTSPLGGAGALPAAAAAAAAATAAPAAGGGPGAGGGSRQLGLDGSSHSSSDELWQSPMVTPGGSVAHSSDVGVSWKTPPGSVHGGSQAPSAGTAAVATAGGGSTAQTAAPPAGWQQGVYDVMPAGSEASQPGTPAGQGRPLAPAAVPTSPHPGVMAAPSPVAVTPPSARSSVASAGAGGAAVGLGLLAGAGAAGAAAQQRSSLQGHAATGGADDDDEGMVSAGDEADEAQPLQPRALPPVTWPAETMPSPTGSVSSLAGGPFAPAGAEPPAGAAQRAPLEAPDSGAAPAGRAAAVAAGTVGVGAGAAAAAAVAAAARQPGAAGSQQQPAQLRVPGMLAEQQQQPVVRVALDPKVEGGSPRRRSRVASGSGTAAAAAAGTAAAAGGGSSQRSTGGGQAKAGFLGSLLGELLAALCSLNVRPLRHALHGVVAAQQQPTHVRYTHVCRLPSCCAAHSSLAHEHDAYARLHMPARRLMCHRCVGLQASAGGCWHQQAGTRCGWRRNNSGSSDRGNGCCCRGQRGRCRCRHRNSSRPPAAARQGEQCCWRCRCQEAPLEVPAGAAAGAGGAGRRWRGHWCDAEQPAQGGAAGSARGPRPCGGSSSKARRSCAACAAAADTAVQGQHHGACGCDWRGADLRAAADRPRGRQQQTGREFCVPGLEPGVCVYLCLASICARLPAVPCASHVLNTDTCCVCVCVCVCARAWCIRPLACSCSPS